MSALVLNKWSENPNFFVGSKEEKFPTLYGKIKELGCENLRSLFNNNDENFIFKRIINIKELELKELGIENLQDLIPIIINGNYFLKSIEKDLSKKFYIPGPIDSN